MSTLHSPAKAVNPRKAPRQQRSAETVAILIEAAARILETQGFAGFNTNAIALKAGVSIGSLYQYFPTKNALLRALMERETAPLVEASGTLRKATEFTPALRLYIAASVHHQMRRPQLARLIDEAEKREMFDEQVTATLARLQTVMEAILTLPGAPSVPDRATAAIDLLALLRSLVDAAGERHESTTPALLDRCEGAAHGYLRAAADTKP